MKVKWLLVDLNSFFASCEQQDDPSLRGRPIAVVPMMAENTSVLAASYEAKKFGIKTGTKVFEARKMCPDIKFVSTGHKKYVQYHHKIIEAVHKVCPVEKVLSIDEMVCCLMGREQELENALEIGRKVKQIILDEVGECLTSSVGLGPNITIAKIASDLQKPNGLVAIPQEQLVQKIGHLDINIISGVGPNMKQRLNQKGFRTINDLLSVSESQLQNAWGSIVGLRLAKEIRGEDFQRTTNKSSTFSHEHVLPPDLRTRAGAYQIIQKLVFKGCSRLRDAKRKAQGIGLSVRFMDHMKFETSIQFQQSDDSFFMMREVEKAYKQVSNQKPIKVGIFLFGLTEPGVEQFSFFDDQKSNKLNKVIDLINDKHGANSIVSAAHLDVVGEAKARISFSHIPDLKRDYE
ncbi:MAG: DNA polymerase [Bdellovibrionaceae bacterium]|nr:DNA polymerase [Pseudobdellovibrionaceae bacterium]